MPQRLLPQAAAALAAPRPSLRGRWKGKRGVRPAGPAAADGKPAWKDARVLSARGSDTSLALKK
eukprot:9998677-Alexandrium_andersonii.AAC.1